MSESKREPDRNPLSLASFGGRFTFSDDLYFRENH